MKDMTIEELAKQLKELHEKYPGFSLYESWKKNEFHRSLEESSLFNYYIKQQGIMFMLFGRWKCPVCGKYNRKSCIEGC